MNEHEQFEILISAYIDGETTPEEEQQIRAHINECVECRSLLENTQKISSLLKTWKDEFLSPDLEQKIQNQFPNQEEKKMGKNFLHMKVGVGVVLVVLVVFAMQQHAQKSLQARVKNASAFLDMGTTIGDVSVVRQESKDSAAIQNLLNPMPTKTEQVEIYRMEGKENVSGGITQLAKVRTKSMSDEMNAEYEPYYLESNYATTQKSTASRATKSKIYEAPLQESVALLGTTESFMAVDKEMKGDIEIYRGGERIEPQEQFNTEQYDRIYESEFLKVTDNPLSTFSIDVDTASYSNIRRFLNQNQMPPEDAVRIEEMVNYFTYKYPQPKGTDPFSITTKASVCPWNQDHSIALIGLQGKTLEEIPSSNLVFLLDVSGSMNQPNKLPLLKTAFSLLVRQLGADDRVAIVVYAGAAGVVLESTPGNQNMTILNSLNQLKAGGSTAGGAGIKLAYEIAAKNFIKGGNNRVILATDGDFNIGVSSDGELTRLIEEKRDQGVFLTVLGFGMGNYKDSRMEKLADKGNGNYYYIDTLKEAQKVLVNELGSTLFTIAKDVKIQIEFNPAQVKAYRLLGYENRILAKEDFNNDEKDAGDLGAGHTVTAIYELVPTASEEQFGNVDELVYQKVQTSQSDDLMTVKLRYKKPEGVKSQLIKKSIQASDVRDELTDDFKFAVSVAEFGLMLRNSSFKGDASYDHVLRSLRESKGADEFGYRAELIDLVEKAQSLDFRSSVGDGKIRFKGSR